MRSADSRDQREPALASFDVTPTQALKSRLDELVDEANINGDVTEDERATFDQAKRRFRDAGPELLDRVTSELWAYYRSTADEFSAHQRATYGIPELSELADVWAQVVISSAPDFSVGESPYEPGSCYISFEGEVSWESEHGLQLVVEDGRRVCKLGPYDGHMTNAHAFGDLSLLGVVYRA